MSRSDEFKNYTCWTRRNIEDSVFPDLGRLPESEASLLEAFAVTAPIIDQSADSTSIDFGELSRRFISSCESDSTEWMFVKGRSGSGKTFLVRRIHLHFPQRDDLRVIYVGRGDVSLRNLARLITEGLPGEAAAKLRADLEKVGQIDLEVEQHCRNILLKMREILETTEFRRHAISRLGLGDNKTRTSQQISALLGSSGTDPDSKLLMNGLGPLLQEVREINEFLSREGGTLRRLARFLRGHAESEGEDENEFVSADLECFEILEEIYESGDERYKSLISLLKVESTAGDEVRVLATKLMNLALPEAIRRASGFSVSIGDVFRDARRELHKEGKKIVLFFEDIALASGQSGAILDVLRDTSSGLAPVKALIAVTHGYEIDEAFQNLASGRFEVPMLTVDSESDVQFAKRMFVRLMNVARLGKTKVAESLETSGAVPNACDACAFKIECHQTFDQIDDIGLYPLNDRSFELAIRKLQADDYVRTGNRAFSPRSVVNLIQKTDSVIYRATEGLLAGIHPTQDFQDMALHKSESVGRNWFDLMPADIRKETASEKERQTFRAHLLYTGSKSHSATMKTCFNLLDTDDVIALDPAPLPAPPLRPGGAQEWLGPEVVAIQNWLDGSEMPQAAGTKIRQAMAKLVRLSAQHESRFLSRGGLADQLVDVVTNISFGIERFGRGESVNPFFSVHYTATEDSSLILQAALWVDEFDSWVQPATKNGVSFITSDSVAVRGRALLESHLGDCTRTVTAIAEQRVIDEVSASLNSRFVNQMILEPSAVALTTPELLSQCLSKPLPIVPPFIIDDLAALLSADATDERQMKLPKWPVCVTGDGEPHIIHFSKLLKIAEQVHKRVSSSPEFSLIVEAGQKQLNSMKTTFNEFIDVASWYVQVFQTNQDRDVFVNETKDLFYECAREFNHLLPHSASTLQQLVERFELLDASVVMQLVSDLSSSDVENIDLETAWALMLGNEDLPSWLYILEQLRAVLRLLGEKVLFAVSEIPDVDPLPVLTELERLLITPSLGKEQTS